MLIRRLHLDALCAIVGAMVCAAAAPAFGKTPGASKSATAAPVSARSNSSVGPGRGRGERQVRPPAAAAARGSARPEPERPSERSHKVGKPPKVPRPTLPSDAIKGAANERMRRSIAGGATSSDLEAGQDDAELRSLRAAERQLFPRSLMLPPPNLDGDLPSAVGHVGPNLSVTGLPLASTGVAAAVRPPPLAWPHGLLLPNLPVSFEQRTLDYVKFYRDSEQGRSIAETWARKAGRYVPAIVAELARAGMPTDLVWMSLVESGHNPTIRSPAGAAGLWQFIPESARLYGLTVDRWVDERLDPMRSTQAALIYLSDLERRFGNWELAMAAYNMGHGGLMRSIRKYNTNDFWRLTRLEAALPWETALYVPKVLATAIVMKNKRAFGLGDIEPDPAASFDTVYVPAGITLASIATQAGVPESAIASLNPQYLAARTPPASSDEPPRLWAVHVPEGQGSVVSQGLERQHVRQQHAVYRVRLGDTPGTIAERLRGSEEELRELNQLDPNERLERGCALLVPSTWSQAGEGGPLPPREDSESVVVLPPQRLQYRDRERVFYHTLPGDDLDRLAQAFRVRPEELVLWNGLDQEARLQSDMLIQVFVPRDAKLEGIRYASERNLGKRLEVGSPSFVTHFEAEQGRQRIQILAREGDTLQSIGKRYGLSAGMMERINHRTRNIRLGEGTPVVVYAKYGPAAAEVLLSRAPDPLPPIDPPDPASLPSAPAQ